MGAHSFVGDTDVFKLLWHCAKIIVVVGSESVGNGAIGLMGRGRGVERDKTSLYLRPREDSRTEWSKGDLKDKKELAGEKPHVISLYIP